MNRFQQSAYSIGGGGLLLVLSAFLPWVAALGLGQARPVGTGKLMLLALGGTLALLAARVHRGKATTAVRVFLWLLSVVEVLAVLGFFAVLTISHGTGLVRRFVQPAIGFYVALFGLVGSLVGTVIMQTSQAKSGTSSSGTWS
jgi:hypothetical protein